MPHDNIRPARWTYGLAGLVLLAGLGGFVWTLLSGLNSVQGSLVRAEMPGRVTLVLEEPGDYTVFHEYESAFVSRTFAPDPPKMDCQLVSRSGQKVALAEAHGGATYSFGGRAGISVMAFTITAPGNYDFVCESAGSDARPAVFTISHGFGVSLVKTVLLSLLILFGSMGLTVAVALAIFFKRRTALTAARAGWAP